MKVHIFRTFVVLLAISLAGTAELAQACQTASPAQSQTQTTTPASNATVPAQTQNATPATDTTAPAQTQNSTPATDAAPTADPTSDTPPVPEPSAVLPNAPSATQDTQSAQVNTATSSTSNQTKEQQPLGAAAAEKGVTRGGAASKPAGTALAGAKQKQSRGLLIKLGAMAAAGVALGTVYALSRSTSPVPPGASRPGALR